MKSRSIYKLILILGFGAWGCQEHPFEQPPIHPNLNMDFQTSFKPQEENEFFADKRAMRSQVPGTLAKGQLRENEAFYTGKNASGYVKKLDMPITMGILKRGENRYNVYCTPCHGYSGKGDGKVIQRNAGMVLPPSFHDQRILDSDLGYFVNVITEGVRNMPAYKHNIPANDRWPIAAYLRALQLSRHASLDQVPAEIRSEKGWRK